MFHLVIGPGSVFMDGNFVSKTSIPHVSPQETFSCSLGMDRAVRIIYHPQKKTASTAGGLMSMKTNVMTFQQRITIKNTRTAPVSRLVVQDQVPISEDSRIRVVVQKPSEKAIGHVHGPTANSGSSAGSSGLLHADQTMIAQVGERIVARWVQKSDEKSGSGGSKGDGVLEWICSDLRDSVDLELCYEVSSPADVEWTAS